MLNSAGFKLYDDKEPFINAENIVIVEAND
jgi:hypothetical protein